MPQLTEDDKVRFTTKLEGLRARVKELEANPNIEKGQKVSAIANRLRAIADLENLLGSKVETPK